MVSLTVWALPGSPALTLENVVLWQAFLPMGAPESWVSLPEQVDRKRDVLRPRYQEWLADIAQRDLDGEPLPDLMAIRSNLSYWWMTLPTDNSLAVNSPAYSIVRLFALADFATSMDIESVTIVAEQPELSEAISSWARGVCTQITIDLDVPTHVSEAHGRVHSAPWLAAGRVFWNHLFIALDPRRKAGRAPLGEGITMVDYLAHLDSPGPDGSFRSNYWGPLVELLQEWPEPVNWLHVTANYATPKVVNVDVAQTCAFNSAKPGHSVLHAYLNVRSVIGALRDYIRISRWGRRLRVIPDLFVERTTGIDPSPLLAGIIKDQYFGRTAALNAFWIRLWESALARRPCQRLGVYLFENQPWELAFIAAWRSCGNGDLIGFSHSTMLFWDLRYFMNPSIHSQSLALEMPQPNLVAINDTRMHRSASEGGYPISRLVVVENLRNRHTGFEQLPSSSIHLLLLLGDYDQESTARMVEMVLEASTAFPDFYLQLRPHPATNHFAWTATYGILTDNEETLESQLMKARKVVTGAHTSASIDALRGGRQTASVQTPRSFPGNPAEGLPGFVSVHTSTEMIRFVIGHQEEKLHSANVDNRGQFDLTLWHQVLSSKQKDALA